MTGFNPLLATISLFVGAAATLMVIFGVSIAMLAAGDLGDSPGKCRNAAFDPANISSLQFRDAVTTEELAGQFQRRWDDVATELDAGRPAIVQFDEGELTSRVTQWVEETDAPLKDVTICIYEGKAEARAHAELPYLADLPILGSLYETDVRVLGRIDLIGDHPEIMIIEMDAGDIPDWAIDPIRDDLKEIVDGRLHQYDIEHTYAVTYREGQIEIVGQP